MPFSFIFSGTFFDMERFFGDVQSFVRVDGKDVDVDGRLLSIDGFGLVAGPGGFPNVKANIVATAYLRTAADDSTSSAATGDRGDRCRGLDGSGSARARPPRRRPPRRWPMSAIRGVLRDLVDRKLWPIAVLLLAAAVAVPIYLGRASADETPLPATSLQADAGKVSKAAVKVDDAATAERRAPRRRAQPLQAAARPQEARRPGRLPTTKTPGRRPADRVGLGRLRRLRSRRSLRAAPAAPAAPATGLQRPSRRPATRSTSTTCRCASAAPRPRS